MEKMELVTLTKKLLAYMDFVEQKYKEVKESGEKGDFYSEVKPFSDEVKEKNEIWRKEVIRWIDIHDPKNLHSKQIESAYEQIELLSIQAFFPETSRTRFINYLQSVIYVLTNVLSHLEKKE